MKDFMFTGGFYLNYGARKVAQLKLDALEWA
uniref:Uncharacterized protein n=1 Tax=Globisporangium ultimum (strain ATCC 200006 / CBS 805.95 / DAOM BR144) TaxID=431595 RepID=K3XCM0_GLOUD